MKFLRELLGRVFAFWAALVFIGSMLLFWIPIWFTKIWPEPKRSVRVFVLFRAWMTCFFTLTGVRRKYVGKENFRPGQIYVVVCNHHSFMDPPLSSPGIPGANKTIAKSEMAKIPIFGMVYKRGSVLVNRKSEESRRQSYMRMREVLNQGMHMCIYPEGTRNRSGEPLQRFHDGAFRLAIESGKAVIPAVLFNTGKVLPRKTFFFWPVPVQMHFLPEIPVTGKTVESLRQEVFTTMHDYYVAHRDRLG